MHGKYNGPRPMVKIFHGFNKAEVQEFYIPKAYMFNVIILWTNTRYQIFTKDIYECVCYYYYTNKDFIMIKDCELKHY